MEKAVNATATVITDLGKNKILKAHAGLADLPAILQIAYGDGATEAPSATDNALQHELLRKDITAVEQISTTCFRYRCELGVNELADQTINETALVDADGDLVVIRRTPDKVKGGDETFVFEMDEML